MPVPMTMPVPLSMPAPPSRKRRRALPANATLATLLAKSLGARSVFVRLWEVTAPEEEREPDFWCAQGKVQPLARADRLRLLRPFLTRPAVTPVSSEDSGSEEDGLRPYTGSDGTSASSAATATTAATTPVSSDTTTPNVPTLSRTISLTPHAACRVYCNAKSFQVAGRHGLQWKAAGAWARPPPLNTLLLGRLETSQKGRRHVCLTNARLQSWTAAPRGLLLFLAFAPFLREHLKQLACLYGTTSPRQLLNWPALRSAMRCPETGDCLWMVLVLDLFQTAPLYVPTDLHALAGPGPLLFPGFQNDATVMCLTLARAFGLRRLAQNLTQLRRGQQMKPTAASTTKGAASMQPVTSEGAARTAAGAAAL